MALITPLQGDYCLYRAPFSQSCGNGKRRAASTCRYGHKRCYHASDISEKHRSLERLRGTEYVDVGNSEELLLMG